MSKILVCGIANVETNLRIDGFPLEYTPINFATWKINSNVAGVGFNISKALATLGDEVLFFAPVAKDISGEAIMKVLPECGISTRFVQRETVEHTPQALILYDGEGRREIFTDLKDLFHYQFPVEAFQKEIKDCKIAVMTNVNFTRPLLSIAKGEGVLIATDVQAIASVDDEYNQDYMRHADILFFSSDKIKVSSEEFIRQVAQRFNNKIICTGRGKDGAMIYLRETGEIRAFEAYHVRPVVNTVGAGDSLFASFLHFYATGGEPYTALKKAMLFASFKIGESGASNGFITAESLEDLYKNF